MRLHIFIGLAAMLVAPQTSADTPELPTYSYAIQSKTFKDAGIFLSGIHMRLPNTLWLCDITYSGKAGMMVRCSTPRLPGGELPEVISHVNCTLADNDAETLHLSTLDQGVYASISIMCKRNLYDDGF